MQDKSLQQVLIVGGFIAVITAEIAYYLLGRVVATASTK